MIENSMCRDITSDEFDLEQETLLEIRHRTVKEKIQSKITIGNISIYNIKKFNFIQRIFYKLCFGMNIKNIRR